MKDGVMKEEIKRFIEYQNHSHGPYGLRVKAIRSKWKKWQFQVAVVNKNREVMWEASELIDEADGGYIFFEDLANAFKFSIT